jgi:hypothetical protein
MSSCSGIIEHPRIIPVAGDRAALVSTFIRLLAESSGRPVPAIA